MFDGHFYHATTRKATAIFGTLFNNISVVRKSPAGEVTNIARVPLSYGPKHKFLSRINEQPDPAGKKIAIKLPRMAFEITSFTPDTEIMISDFNKITRPDASDTTKTKVIQNSVPYRIGMQLNIMTKNQDDIFQIMEQIVPYFRPAYSVSIIEGAEMNIKTDVPVNLISVTLGDDYEGDFESRRAIVATLDFELRVTYHGPVSSKSIIRKAIVGYDINSPDDDLNDMKYTIAVSPANAGPDDEYDLIETTKYLTSTDEYEITTDEITTDGDGFVAGETITGSESAYTATVVSYNPTTNSLIVEGADGQFELEEITSASATANITAIKPILS